MPEPYDPLLFDARLLEPLLGPSCTKLERRAARFAQLAHARVGQRRKYTHEPYILHPGAVATLVREVSPEPEVLAAAWLHDTVEDTDVTLDELETQFGAQVARLVSWLTERARPQDGNRAQRKALERAVLALAPPQAQTVKLADLLDNSRNILAHDPAFGRVYLQEKAALLEVLEQGDAHLLARARVLVAQERARLG